MFTIDTEPGLKLVRMKLSGMLTVEEVAELYRQEHAAILAMGCPLGEQIVLADLTECPLQLSQIVDAFQASMGRPEMAWRLAIVTGLSLSRMQARRLAQREGIRIFATVEDAEEWLFAEALRRAA